MSTNELNFFEKRRIRRDWEKVRAAHRIDTLARMRMSNRDQYEEDMRMHAGNHLVACLVMGNIFSGVLVYLVFGADADGRVYGSPIHTFVVYLAALPVFAMVWYGWMEALKNRKMRRVEDRCFQIQREEENQNVEA